MRATDLDISRLSVAERIQLAEDLWDSVAAETGELPLSEAQAHPHNLARQSHVDVQGVRHPAPAPRFSRTASAIQGPPPVAALSAQDALARWS